MLGEPGEIYHRISYVGPCRSALEFAPDAPVINSFSTYYSMVGWLVVQPDLVEEALARLEPWFAQQTGQRDSA